ncbi:MAG TPA: type II toxin-antitoxin system Phd/YefM family antitoxin [Dehalococcoidia bacterium]|nr:type II toxin-antitoxin system Phd/YefM family antitoxin [Dehalococcoidia bacterium]
MYLNDRATVSQTEAKQRLGDLVKRVAYGGERIVLENRGKPQAALVSIADLEALEEGARGAIETPRVAEAANMYTTERTRRLDDIYRLPAAERTLRALDELRVIARRAAARGVKSDVARELDEMREERSNELADLS